MYPLETKSSKVFFREVHDKFEAYIILVGLCSPLSITVKTSIVIWKLDLRGLNLVESSTNGYYNIIIH